MPRSCPACELNRDDSHALTAALVCGESYYALGKRFGLSAMAVSRHWQDHLLIPGGRLLRERAIERGPRRIRARLLRAVGPVLAPAVKAWIAGARPKRSTLEWTGPDLGPQLRSVHRQRAALARALNW